MVRDEFRLIRHKSAEAIDHKVPGASSARKMLGVLLCFSPEKPHWTVPELGDRLDASISTTYRFVALLREVGLLQPAGENAYRLSERVVVLARAAQQGRSSLEEISLDVMTRIRDATDETVLIARRQHDHAYCVERVESRQPVRLQFDRGQPMALHRGAMSRVLLANAPRSERDHYLAAITNSLSERSAALLTPEKLDEVARSGYTQSFEEIDLGIWGAAAAITVDDHTVAALGVAGPIYRLDEAKRERIIKRVCDGAREISEKLRGVA
jgi:DNA-binding IclR family transcriptional regulator